MFKCFTLIAVHACVYTFSYYLALSRTGLLLVTHFLKCNINRNCLFHNNKLVKADDVESICFSECDPQNSCAERLETSVACNCETTSIACSLIVDLRANCMSNRFRFTSKQVTKVHALITLYLNVVWLRNSIIVSWNFNVKLIDQIMTARNTD